jgi:hypothetical protein
MLDSLATVSEKEEDGRSYARERLGIELRGVMGAGKRLAAPVRHGDGTRGAGRDAETLARRGEIALLLPAAVALDLVARVKSVAFEQAVS